MSAGRAGVGLGPAPAVSGCGRGTIAGSSRRTFVTACLGAAAARRSARGQGRDVYGGWTGKRFRPTGHFRLEHDGRWWMVTPEGNAFLSFGANHLHPGWWKAAYNGAHWAAEYGLGSARDPRFNARYRSEMMSLLPELGFNSIGVHSDLATLNDPRPFIPYVKPFVLAGIDHWKVPEEGDFPDVFSPEFEASAGRLASREAAPLRDDPMLLGYAMADCPIFTDWDARERGDTLHGAPRRSLPTFPRVLRNLGAAHAGKRAYVETVRELYGDSVSRFNAVYGTEFGSFDALASAVNWRRLTDPANGHETRDNTEFLLRVVDRYYGVARRALRSQDPNHLFFGDKLNGNTDAVDTVVAVTSRHTDLVFYQAYGRYGWLEPSLGRWGRKTGKPLFNGDSSFATPGENMPRPYGPLAADHRERAEWMLEYARAAFGREDFVGWSHCGVIDTWTELSERKQLRQHAGIMSPTGEFHGPVRDAIREIGQRLYEFPRAPRGKPGDCC